MQILVIGNHEAVLGFSLVGIQGKVAATGSEINQTLDEALASKDIGIILVTEDVAKLIETRMDQLKLRSTVPLVVEIPGPQGMSPDRPSINEIVLRAIGVKF